MLFRGNAEAAIRQQLVRSGYLKGIIGLPANLFYGTGIPACIVVLDKENAAARKGVFMIDASKGFIKDGNKNRLREQDIHRIVDTFTRQVDVPRYARMVPLAEIADPKNDFNLNLPRYIDSTEPEDLQDIDGHLRGGIPERDLDALGAYWRSCPACARVLFEYAGRPGYCAPEAAARRGEARHLRPRRVHRLPADRRRSSSPNGARPRRRCLNGFGKDGHPKALIETIAEDLLATFRHAPLLDAYDVYQHLMDYWAETMQDDRYLIAADGWVKGAQPREIVQVKNKDNKLVWPEPHDLPEGQAALQVGPRSRADSRRPLLRRRTGCHRSARNQLATLEQQLDEMREEQQRRGRAACRGDRGRGRQAEDHREGREGAAEGDRQRPGSTPTSATALEDVR